MHVARYVSLSDPNTMRYFIDGPKDDDAFTTYTGIEQQDLVAVVFAADGTVAVHYLDRVSTAQPVLKEIQASNESMGAANQLFKRLQNDPAFIKAMPISDALNDRGGALIAVQHIDTMRVRVEEGSGRRRVRLGTHGKLLVQRIIPLYDEDISSRDTAAHLILSWIDLSRPAVDPTNV